MPSDPSAFLALGDEHFVSLTTFRRSGAAVPTPVWVARDGDTLVVLTPAESGKVKRVRNSGRVELAPCGRFGRVAAGVVPLGGHAEIVADPATTERLTGVIRRAYGVEYRITMLVERIAARRQKPRVVLSITAAPTAPAAEPG